MDRDKEKQQDKSDNQPKEAGNNARDKVRNPKCAIQAHVQHLQAYVSKWLSIVTSDAFINAKPFSFFCTLEINRIFMINGKCEKYKILVF